MRAFSAWVMVFILILLALLYIARLLGAYGWYFAMLSHFPVYLTLFALAMTLVALLQRQWKTTGGLAFLTVLHGIPFFPDLYALPRTGPSGTPLTIMLANVQAGNRDYKAFLALVKENNPDVLVVIEAAERWMDALQAVELPYRIDVPADTPWGISIFSRYEFQENQSFKLDLVLALQVRIMSQPPITLIATHTNRQASAYSAKHQDREIEALAQKLLELKDNAVMVADLNATPWSRNFQQLLATSQFQDSRKGFGLQGSWPASLPEPFRLPIDHLLVSKDITIQSRSISDAFGSDHRAVIAHLVLAHRP